MRDVLAPRGALVERERPVKGAVRAGIAAVIVVTAGLACSEGTLEVSLPDQLPDNIVLSVAVTPDTIIAGSESAEVVVEVRNTDPLRVAVLDFSSDCPVVFGVRNATGEVVHPLGGDWECTRAPTRLRIEPDSVARLTTEWDGTNSQGVLPAGEYAVFGALDSDLKFPTAPEPLVLQ